MAAKRGKRHIPASSRGWSLSGKGLTLCGRTLAIDDDPALAPCLMCLDQRFDRAMDDESAARKAYYAVSAEAQPERKHRLWLEWNAAQDEKARAFGAADDERKRRMGYA